MNRFIKIIVFLYLSLTAFSAAAQSLERPFIWVKQKDKADILRKIESQTWAKTFYTAFKSRLDKDIEVYKNSPKDFLIRLPLDWSDQSQHKTPPFKRFDNFTDANYQERLTLNQYLQIGIDCGVLYFLTEEDIYAQCALDILHNFNESISQLQPSDKKGNGGWIYPLDHLREARVFGAQIPIIYDFIAPYIKAGNKAYDVGQNKLIKFSEEKSQNVILTYAKLAVEHGHTGSNWSVLESFSLVQNALAIDDLEQREKYLDYYLTKGTDQQDALPDIFKKYKEGGDVYPETSQYSIGVAIFTTRLLLILDKYNPDLQLGKKYYKIPSSLDQWNKVAYPNNEIIRFGDGKRKLNVPYASYDMAYHLGKQNNVPQLTEKFGPLISKSIADGKYDRAKVGKRSEDVTVYYTPLKLLWFDTTEDYSYEKSVLPRTDKFSHAGVFLQRNLSPTGDPDDGLMCFVGGAHMVHGHASGMDMELYGLGEVLGVDHGRGKYRTDLHENYSRLFAAHNTIIVNGASQGEGGWINLGINSTELITMEPMPTEVALSPHYSFSRTSFIDDKGDKAGATQERTLALIRTSPTSGYYIDVFRSDSELPDEYHDYLYHNIGDKLKFKTKGLDLYSDKNRFQANANDIYIRNQNYRNPGWHFFENVVSSTTYGSDVKATFEIKKLHGKNRYMNLFIIGNKDREYTKALAPKTFEAPEPYDDSLTPTLVIRQKGEAWTNPFAVVYEPTFDKKSKYGIQSVTKLETDGIFKGFKVTSKTRTNTITQFIISQEKGDVYKNESLDCYFKGGFAIITLDENQKVLNIYIGEGEKFTINNVTVRSKNIDTISVYIDFTKEKNTINRSENTEVIIN